VRYAFIERHKQIWPVADQCRVLEVAASGFRAWRKRRSGEPWATPGKRVPDLALLTHIRAEFAASKETYGWPRMVKQLRSQGLRVGKERIRKTMKNNDIRVRSRRRFKVTTDSNHNLPIAPNLLNRVFATEAPNNAWVGDATMQSIALTSPMSGPPKAGFIWRPSSISSAGRWSASPWGSAWARNWWWTHCAWPGSVANRRRD
jgi:hypothetical protein